MPPTEPFPQLSAVPAYEVAGGRFDYALNTDVLHVAIIDSVGHDSESSIISHLVNGSLRNSRRNGRDLPRPASGPTRR